jgi:hypothetical protein
LLSPVTGENFKEPVMRTKKGGLNIQKAQRLFHTSTLESFVVLYP